MPRQISDEEYQYYLGRTQVANFAESIFNDPALNNDSRALIKKKYPNLDQGPYDTEQRLNAKIAELRKERDDEKKAVKDEEDKGKWSKQRKATQDRYGFTEDAMKKLEELMVAENIGNYEAGALLLASREPQTIEPQGDRTHWNHEKAENFKDIAKDPEAWGRQEIMAAIHRDEQTRKNQRF